MMTIEEIKKFNIPPIAPRAELWSAPSTVLISKASWSAHEKKGVRLRPVVNRLRILPIGVTSKNLDGALTSRLSIFRNNDLEACKLA
jgi:hypothetical protein